MRRILLALVLVTGCGADAGNDHAPAAAKAVDLSSLTGLYEGGASLQPSQMCMIGSAERAAFGLVLWSGGNMGSCAGSGTAERQGEVLRLAMAGDQPCTFDARMEGGRVTLPSVVPESCAYYCGKEASLGGAAFDKKGGAKEDALRARDLVGEPLCAGIGPPPKP